MKKILVIEDEPMLKDLIEEMLRINGYTTYSSSNGKEALELFKRKGADLIICDIIMPGISGFDVLQEIRRDLRNAALPVILLTGKTDRADFRHGMELGADDFIPKPFTEEELIGSVAAQLKKKEAIYSGMRLDQNEHIMLNIDGQPKMIKISSLKCISALGDYSNVITADGKYIIRKPMKEWEEILPVKQFIRIHRSTIINLDYVEKIERLLNRGYKVYIRNVTKPYIISRRYGSRIKDYEV